MNDDVNMQHMTMKEYVAVAMLSELGTKDNVLKLISDGEMTATRIIESCFNWAELFMEVRKKRNAET